MNLEHITQKVFEVYQACDLHTFPIDCFSILEHYGLRTITYLDIKRNNERLYQAIINYSKDAFRFRTTVYYNSCTNHGRIRFSLMHELGHYILGHTQESRANEEEADCFASYMIAPRVAIEQFQCTTSDELHQKFGLSYAASNRTLIDYNRWKDTERVKIDQSLFLWIFHKEWYLRKTAAMNRLQREKRKLKSQLAFQEERTTWLLENAPEYFDRSEWYHLEHQRLGDY